MATTRPEVQAGARSSCFWHPIQTSPSSAGGRVPALREEGREWKGRREEQANRRYLDLEEEEQHRHQGRVGADADEVRGARADASLLLT